MTQPNQLSAQMSDMIPQSLTVISKPSVDTFERFERRGTTQQAITYVAVASLAPALVGLLNGGIGGLLIGFLSGVLGYLVFTYLVYFIGKAQGGTGTQDEVFYTFALFNAPLQVVSAALSLIGWIFGWIPLLGFLVGIVLFLAGIVVWIAGVYYGYLAVQSSHNFKTQQQQSQALITLIGAALAAFVVNLIIGAILGSFFVLSAIGRAAF